MAGERILVVEDDSRIGSTLLRALSGAGYEAEWAQSGREGLDMAAATPFQLVLLDLGLPDVEGLDACREMHGSHPTMDIIILTARDDELDIVVGLDAGAVDYVTKPFKLAELLARIRAQLRRTEPRSRGRVEVGGLVVDTASRRVWIDDDEVVLRAKEFDLLSRLTEDVGAVVSRDDLMSDVWDDFWPSSTKTLDFHIAALRRKIDASDQPSRITTLRGVGYRLEPQ